MLFDKGFDGKMGRYIVGYDLGDDFAQISFMTLNQEEPETISMVATGQQYNIPAVLCKREEMNQWFYGKEALRVSGEGEGIRIDELLTKARKGETVVIEEQEFGAIPLLTLFVKRSLGLFTPLASLDKIEQFVITTDYLDERTIKVLEEVVVNIGLKTKKIYFQNHMESIYDFMLHQTKDLWEGQTIVFDYRYPCLKSYRMECNRRTTPIVTIIDKQEYPDLEMPQWPAEETEVSRVKAELDQQFYLAIQDLFKERMITAVYLIGDGFKEEWQNQTLRFLCQGRRVFKGNNLYSKGAAFGAQEKLCPSEMGKDHVFLGPEKLKANVGMQVVREGEESYLALLDAGRNWYETQNSQEVYLEEGNRFLITITALTPSKNPYNGLDRNPVRYEEIILEGLPERPKHTTRIAVSIHMKAVDKMVFEVEDLGFGEIFPATHQIWKQEIDL